MYAKRLWCMRNDQDRVGETTSMYANRLLCESTCMQNDRLPYFIWKVIQLSKLQFRLKVFNRCHSSFSTASANFSTTRLSNSFRKFFPGRLLACLAQLNASHCNWYLVACFSLKSSTRTEYFSFCFGPGFWTSLPARLTTMNFDHTQITPRSDIIPASVL